MGTARDTSARRAGREAMAALAAVSIVLLAVFLTGSEFAKQSVMLASGIVALVSIGTGMRVHRVRDQQPWFLASLGLTLLTVVNTLAWAGGVRDGIASPWPVAPFQIAGYLALLAASLLIVRRRTPHDSGGVIDAAVLGLAAAAPVWEFVLRPALTRTGATTAGQVVVLTQILVLLSILGALLHISRASGRQQVSVWLLFTSLTSAVLGDVVLTAGGGTPGAATSLSGVLYLIGYLAVGAAPLHPSITTLTLPVPVHTPGVPKLRLSLFGGALVIVPVVGGIPQLFGTPPDGLLLTLGPLLMVPLVLFRTGRLMTQRAQGQRDLAYQASHDDLTGLVNRRRIFAAVTQAMAVQHGGDPPPAAVLYCDLDDFKPINDRYGHDAGDEVLRCAARRITATLHAHDVVARIGGDEFLAYCPDVDEAAANILRQRLEDALQAPIDWNGTTLRVGATVGAAISGPGRYASPDELIAAADAAMYERKRTRKAARQARATTAPASAGHRTVRRSDAGPVRQ